MITNFKNENISRKGEEMMFGGNEHLLKFRKTYISPYSATVEVRIRPIYCLNARERLSKRWLYQVCNHTNRFYKAQRVTTRTLKHLIKRLFSDSRKTWVCTAPSFCEEILAGRADQFYTIFPIYEKWGEVMED